MINFITRIIQQETKNKNSKYSRNIVLFYLMRFFASMVLVSPIFIIFLQENGLSMTQIMVMQSYYMIIILIMSVPAGAISDKIGRTKATILSEITFTGGWFIYYAGTSLWHFYLAETIMAISSSLWSASFSSFLYDSLKEIRKSRDFKKVYGRVYLMMSITAAIGSILGGFVAKYDIRLAFLITGFTTFGALIVSIFLKEPKRKVEKKKGLFKLIWHSVIFSWKTRKVRYLMIISSLITGVGFSFYMFNQPYLKELGLSLPMFGLVYFGMNILGGFGAAIAHKLEKFLGMKKTLIVIALVPGLIFVVMAFIRNPWAAILPLFATLFFGLELNVIEDYLNKEISSEKRATVLSINYMMNSMVCAIIAPIVGIIGDSSGLKEVYLLFSAVMIATTFFVFYFNQMKNSRSLKTKTT